MKAITYSIIIMLSLVAANSYGQQSDSTRRKSVAYLSHYLNTDTTTAGKVIIIQESYKKAVKKIIENASLTEQQRRAAIDNLIDEKNVKLGQLLPAHQRDMLVPTTERRRNWKADTAAIKTR